MCSYYVCMRSHEYILFIHTLFMHVCSRVYVCVYIKYVSRACMRTFMYTYILHIHAGRLLSTSSSTHSDMGRHGRCVYIRNVHTQTDTYVWHSFCICPRANNTYVKKCMYMYMCVYIYIYIYTHTHTKRIRTQTHIHTRTQTQTHTIHMAHLLTQAQTHKHKHIQYTWHTS